MLRHLQALQPRMASRAVLSAVQAASLARPFSTLPRSSAASLRIAKFIPSVTGAASLQFERRSSSDNVKASFTRGGVRSFSSSSVASLKAGDSFEGKTTSGMFTIKKRLAASGALDKIVPYDEVMEDLRLIQATSGVAELQKYKELQLTLATHQLLAARKGKQLTLGFVLDNFEADRSALWRILTWRVIYNKPDEKVQLLTKKERVLAELMTHYAIGASKAERYYEAGLRTIEDLVSSSSVQSFVRIGAEYHKDLLQFIPLAEANEWRELINEAVDATQLGLRFELVGRPRCGELLSEEIRVVTWDPVFVNLLTRKDEVSRPLPKLIDELEKRGLIVAKYKTGGQRCKVLVRAPPGKDGVTKLVRRLEITYTANPGEILIAETGNAAFLQAVRKRSQDMYEWFGVGHYFPSGSKTSNLDVGFKTESDVFDRLGLEYLKPEERCKTDYKAWLRQQPMPLGP